jgi:hypothetical protein
MAWHLGYPLSQTLFTNVYIEGILMPMPQTIEQADFVRDQAERDPMLVVLRAYCLGLLKACHHVNERIKGEHYYEVTWLYRQHMLQQCRRTMWRIGNFANSVLGGRLRYEHLPQITTGRH